MKALGIILIHPLRPLLSFPARPTQSATNVVRSKELVAHIDRFDNRTDDRLGFDALAVLFFARELRP